MLKYVFNGVYCDHTEQFRRTHILDSISLCLNHEEEICSAETRAFPLVVTL